MYKWNPFTNNLDEKGDWFFGGNTLSSKKTLGSIDNQDFGIITNNTERLTVLKGGNVGIGTTNPGAKLDVNVGANGDVVIGQNSTYTNYNVISTNGVLTDSGFQGFGGGGGFADFYMQAPSGGGLHFRTNGNSEKMTILSNGNVGIGTTNPTAKLDVTGGNIDIDNTTFASQTGVITKNGTRFIHDFNYGDNGTVTTDGANVFMGRNAGNFSMGSTATATYQASYNTGVGVSSLLSNTIGYQNTALGGYSLQNNTSGSNNSALGFDSLNLNTTGTSNSALGYYSLYSNVTGNNGVALGFESQKYVNSTTTAWTNQNTSVGYQALRGSGTAANNTGNSNTAMGYASLYSNTTGNSNTANGAYSLTSNTTGSSNTALGIFSGRYIADKSTGALNSNNSVFLGYRTSPLADNQTNQIVIGYDAIGIGSNSVVLGNDSVTKTILKGNVGIGTTAPNAKLQVVGTARIGEYTDNFTEFEANGTLKMNGTAIVYDDVNTSVAAAKLPAVGNPDWETFTTNTNAYTFKINDFADLGTIEIPHSYKEGSDLEVHLHLATNGTNNATERKVKYIIYYTYGISDNGSNQFITEASLTAELTIPANQLDKSTYYLSMGTIPGTGIKIGTQLKMRIKRIAGTGTEPANNPFLGQVGVHFQKDTIGSRTMTSK